MSRSFTIDLNADVGESPDALADGREEALLRLVTSANVACGGHAGDETTMAAVVALAGRLGVAVGAHPSYPDRAGFGRAAMGLSPAQVEDAVLAQVSALGAVARRAGVRPSHVKPHGALYNDAARDAATAGAVARAVAHWDASATLVGPARSRLLEAGCALGVRTVAEGFADRAYEPDGTLRSRALPGALILDPERAAAQAVAIALGHPLTAHDGSAVSVEAATICIPGDTAEAVAIARAVRAALAHAGVTVAGFGGRP